MLCRGEKRNYPGKKVRLNRESSSQSPGHESDTLTTEPPGRGHINMDRNIVSRHGDPVTPHVVATKSYVDSPPSIITAKSGRMTLNDDNPTVLIDTTEGDVTIILSNDSVQGKELRFIYNKNGKSCYIYNENIIDPDQSENRNLKTSIFRHII